MQAFNPEKAKLLSQTKKRIGESYYHLKLYSQSLDSNGPFRDQTYFIIARNALNVKESYRFCLSSQLF